MGHTAMSNAFACQPPYYAVIFTSQRTDGDSGYAAMAQRMEDLAREQPGFLGMESVRDEQGAGITVSYWIDRESIDRWREHAAHLQAQERGREQWYESFSIRICRVEHHRDWSAAVSPPEQ
jgi:heme-degrading monooxygenase HmoA